MRTYNNAVQQPSDIWKHLPILKKYAEECETIVEIGLGFGNSTLAFLEAAPKLVTTIEIDPRWNEGIQADLRKIADEKNVRYDIIFGDSRSENTNVPHEMDFLFIDGDHSHLTVKRELELYANRVKKYIGFHDIVTFGYRDMIIVPENPNEHGINWAIERFLEENNNWKIDYVSIFNNGLLILKNNG
jgi:cephalosporin hydroxylase